MLTKGQRRQIKNERIINYARNNNIPWNIEADEEERSQQKNFLAMRLMKTLGLDPIFHDENKPVLWTHIGFDDNKYKTFRMKTPVKNLDLNNFIYRLVCFAEEGGPYEPGDLKALKISRTACNILDATQGEGWREEISERIRHSYSEGGRHNSSYDILKKDVSFKIAMGELMVRAPLGNATCSNDNIVLRDTILPSTMLMALPGKPVSTLMDGNVYKGAFTNAIVKTAKCEQKTTIIEIVKDIIPVVSEFIE